MVDLLSRWLEITTAWNDRGSAEWPRTGRVFSRGAPGARLRLAGLSAHAAKADVRGRGVDRMRVARRWPVSAAIAGRAKVRSALQHLARDTDVRVANVVAAALVRPDR